MEGTARNVIPSLPGISSCSFDTYPSSSGDTVGAVVGQDRPVLEYSSKAASGKDSLSETRGETVQNNQEDGTSSRTFSWLSSGLYPASWTLRLFSSRSLQSDGGTDNSVPKEVAATTTIPNRPQSLEGTLAFRKSRSSRGSSGWKHVYVVLNLTDGGSLTCFREKPKLLSINQQQQPKNKQSLLRPRRQRVPGDTRPQLPGHSLLDHISDLVYGNGDENDAALRFHLSADIPWFVKDIESSSEEFVIVVPTNRHVGANDEASGGNCPDPVAPNVPDLIADDYRMAAAANKWLRLYFRCAKKTNEKTLWLHALEQVDRLSYKLHSKRGLESLFTVSSSVRIKHCRLRNQLAAQIAREGTTLLVDQSDVQSLHEEDPGYKRPLKRVDDRGEMEFLVHPKYAYPNRWMTEREMHAEMLKSSESFHDLRTARSSLGKEIGVLKVEALECIGLPALDFASETDAVVYFVCGSYAFTTDVIRNKLNPKWLPRSRRACVFPIHHAYARLFVGVFDDDGKNEKDDFAGRVVIDLSRLRPRSTYDVTLPLRLSSQVYSRSPRGSIRLRFSLEWHSERDALMSYVPKTIRSFSKSRPEDDVTILCADEKGFRNIATTVHGRHMKGRFSTQKFKATMREMNFTRKVALKVVREFGLGIVVWKNPVVSGLIFLAWMHCIYKGTASLIPFYVTFFLFLGMVRSYAFYGSDGPVQRGFVPPSFEEMVAALVSNKDTNVIEPLRVRPMRHTGNNGRRTYMSNKALVQSGRKPVILKQRGMWMFKSESDPEIDPAFYDMEFPFSQGFRDPLSGELCYKKLSVQDALVVKSTKIKTKKWGADGSDHPLDDTFGFSHGPNKNVKGRKRLPFERLSITRVNRRKRNSAPPSLLSASLRDEGGGDDRELKSSSRVPQFESLPPCLRFPHQDIDKRTVKKKKLTEELEELRENVHKLSFHLFNDRTHVSPKADALYFGNNKRSGKSGAALEAELERALNLGPHSSANPVIARVGLYIEPIVDAVQSGLCISRVIYNICTWRDPMLSFWVTNLFMLASLFLFLFPWRLFLLLAGGITVGPQNWLLRLLYEHRMAPAALQNLIDRRRQPNQIDDTRRSKIVSSSKIECQPIFSAHTSDNSAPLELSHCDVDPRSLHQVCVPYSQINGTTRFYDWPPQPQYAKCTPNQFTIQETLTMRQEKLQRQLSCRFLSCRDSQ